ncbi:MAG: phosphoenolpyruvate carboxykinase (GTP) [bacterium]
MMMEKYVSLLKEKCGKDNYEKLLVLNNPEVELFIAKYVELCNPRSVFVRTDSKQDVSYIRDKAMELKEEIPLAIEGHSAHLDGYFDQGRDKEQTKFLVTKDMDLGSGLNSIEREQGLKEVHSLLKNIMDDKEMFVLFLCLGPVNSDFSIYGVQITDSSYVGHSEDILYRPAYEAFKKYGRDIDFFKYVHSAGELENNVSKNVKNRRIYTDFIENKVYSVNTQYAGNTLGLKKLSLRLAIRKAGMESNWLSEHMFVMAVHGPDKRKTYFTGAFPSFCGKTSTCMVAGETIIGDDIAYLRKRNGKVFAVNVERGIFGIVKSVNSQDDPLIYKALTTPGEVIFSNILVKDGTPYWLGYDGEVPQDGINFSGEWSKGKKDAKSNEIPHAHANARYTVKLDTLANCDSELENPDGVEVKGIIYGGRDSDTWPPVFESFDWKHGVITIGASLESETTAATLGQQGVRKFNIMANMDFLSIPVGKYINNHLDFASDLKGSCTIFGVNYFLRDKKGEYLTGMHYKRVWLKWMEMRVHGEVDAIKTPIGYLPKYDDLKSLFKEVLGHDYSTKEYLEEFTLRIPENTAKIKRIEEIYKTKVLDTPKVVLESLAEQKKRFEEARKKYGDYVKPMDFLKK